MKTQEQKYKLGDRITTNIRSAYNYASKHGITELNSLKVEAKPVEVAEEPKEALESEIEAIKESIEQTKEKSRVVKAKSEALEQIINTKKK